MKRVVALLFLTALLAAPFTARADDPEIPAASAVSGALLTEPSTGARLYAVSPEERRSVAGLSKLPAILTLAQSIDDGSVSESATVHVSARAANVPGPTAFLASGEEIAVRELVKAAVMISAGDAILSLGESAYGSESMFVENINTTLRNTGVNASVTDAFGTGLLLSPAELVLLGKAALASNTFSKYCALYLDGIVHGDGRETELVSANRLLKSYNGCRGLMTGSSAADGYCGVFAATRNGTNLIVAVTGAKSAVDRTAAAAALFDYAFANFRFETVCKAGEALATAVPVRDGDQKTVDLVAKESVTVVQKSRNGKLVRELELPEYLEAPLASDVPAANAVYRDAEGNVAATVPLYPASDVIAYGITDILREILSLFC